MLSIKEKKIYANRCCSYKRCLALSCVWLLCNPMDCSLPGSSMKFTLNWKPSTLYCATFLGKLTMNSENAEKIIQHLHKKYLLFLHITSRWSGPRLRLRLAPQTEPCDLVWSLYFLWTWFYQVTGHSNK